MKKKIGINIMGKGVSRCLYAAVAVFTVTVVASQIGLAGRWRETLTDISTYESVGTENMDGNILNKASVSMSIEGTLPSEGVDILVNGEKVDSFEGNQKQIEVFSDSVIEVCSLGEGEIKVNLDAVDDALQCVTEGNSVTVNGGIEVLCRVVFK